MTTSSLSGAEGATPGAAQSMDASAVAAQDVTAEISASQDVPALHGLRGFAALTVFVSHFSNAFDLFGGLFGRGAGQVGVMLFFALSGYLMGRLYLGESFSRAAVLTFLRRRVARVVPLYLAVVAAAFGLGLYGVTRSNLVEHLLFVRGSGVLWTIPVEIQFYALFPVLWWAHQRDPVMTCVWAAILVIALSWGSPALDGLGRTLGFFLAGVAVSRLPGSRGMNLAFVVALVAFVASLPQVRLAAGMIDASVWRGPLYPLVVMTLLYTTIHSPLAARIFGNRLACGLGAISYSVYLVHDAVIAVVKAQGLGAGSSLLLAVAGTLALSILTYRIIEVPLRSAINGGAGRR